MGRGNGKAPDSGDTAQGRIPVSHETYIHTFGHEVKELDGGVMDLVLTKLNGEQEHFLFASDNARAVGRKLAGQGILDAGGRIH